MTVLIKCDSPDVNSYKGTSWGYAWQVSVVTVHVTSLHSVCVVCFWHMWSYQLLGSLPGIPMTSKDCKDWLNSVPSQKKKRTRTGTKLKSFYFCKNKRVEKNTVSVIISNSISWPFCFLLLLSQINSTYTLLLNFTMLAIRLFSVLEGMSMMTIEKVIWNSPCFCVHFISYDTYFIPCLWTELFVTHTHS